MKLSQEDLDMCQRLGNDPKQLAAMKASHAGGGPVNVLTVRASDDDADDDPTNQNAPPPPKDLPAKSKNDWEGQCARAGCDPTEAAKKYLKTTGRLPYPDEDTSKPNPAPVGTSKLDGILARAERSRANTKAVAEHAARRLAREEGDDSEIVKLVMCSVHPIPFGKAV
jgi:hypothetical protein